MKKITAFIICIMIISLLSVANASVKRDAATIAASYNAWASAFGATDITWEQEIRDDTANTSIKYLYSDDIIIKYDFSDYQFNVEWVLFRCNAHTGGTTAYNMARKLALFAALEYGQPKTFTTNEIDEAYTIAQEAFDDYSIAMVSNQDKLLKNEPILFRMNEYGRYYIYYNNTIGFCISVE